MALSTYQKKRDFKQTAEPKGAAKKKAEGKALRFVVQRHHASRLHYDFRLEMGGVLKSWAVPKGPSLNPEDKRLAMMVEDHPYAYRTFEGEIPKGNYGAGVVHIFDEGTYTPEDPAKDEKELLKDLEAGSLKIILSGRHLKGGFALVKMKNTEDNAWLLIKHRDNYATKARFDAEDLVTDSIKTAGTQFKTKTRRVIKPMLASLYDQLFDDAGWLFEKKLDGYRAIAHTGNNTRLYSRNGLDFKGKYPAISRALKSIGREAVLDGEIVAEDSRGNARFQNLQLYRPANKEIRLRYYVFDLLELDGHPLYDLELHERKELLQLLIRKAGQEDILFLDHINGPGNGLYQEAKKQGWEGVIAKKADSSYLPGKRSSWWRKVKVHQSQEAIIIGYTRPEGSRHYFGALVLALYEGETLRCIGNCGTGFTEQTLKMLHQEMSRLETGEKPVKEAVQKEKTVTWLKPELVCEVTYSEWTTDRRLRHPVFKGLREDKGTEEVMEEHATEETLTFGRTKVQLTNQQKLYWPEERITKGQLIQYYRRMAPHILPYLKDRPLSLNRHPNGITKPGFYQKDLDTDQIPKWIKTAEVYSESMDKNIDYLICNDEATLLWMANLGCIEINPWLSTWRKQEHPIFGVMDIDPHDVDFKVAVAVALTTKKLLDKAGITSYIKTSGSTGLHIFIHVAQQYPYEVVKDFIQLLGELVHEQHPDTTSLERTPSKRKNKIYLDYLQNRRGQTIAAPYSVRPKPGATVSMPLHWDEVTEKLSLADYHIFNAEERIHSLPDPWKGVFRSRANLKKALAKLSG